MKKIVSMKTDTKGARLQKLAEEMESVKMEFAELVDEYEEEGADSIVMDTLSEALAAVDDAIDGMSDVLERI
ncbi:MAG: hypothetical protein Q4B00_10270 [Eubacteriales bacterium]|nr:hypothetical protein [Eubacteriales bacterium]